jgi:hypothetical protein
MGMMVEGHDAGTGIKDFVAYLRIDRLVLDRPSKSAVVRVSAYASKEAADQGKVIGQPVEYMVTDPEPAPVLVSPDPNQELKEGEQPPEPRWEMSNPPKTYTRWFSPEALAKSHKDPFAQAYEWLKTENEQFKDAKLA